MAEVKIKGDASGFSAAINKVKGDAAGLSRSLNQAGGAGAGVFGKLGSMAGAIATPMGAAAAGIGIAAAGMIKLGMSIKETVDRLDQLGDRASRMGVSTDFMQRWSFAAGEADTSIQAVSRGINKMAQAMKQADLGILPEEIKAVYDSIGVSLDDLKGKTPEQAFTLVLGKLKGIADEKDRIGTLMALFGRGGAQLNDLAKSADAYLQRWEDTRGGVSQDQIKRASELSDALTDGGVAISSAWDRVQMSIVEAIGGGDIQTARQNLLEFIGQLEVGAGIVVEGTKALWDLGQTINELIPGTHVMRALGDGLGYVADKLGGIKSAEEALAMLKDFNAGKMEIGTAAREAGVEGGQLSTVWGRLKSLVGVEDGAQLSLAPPTAEEIAAFKKIHDDRVSAKEAEEEATKARTEAVRIAAAGAETEKSVNKLKEEAIKLERELMALQMEAQGKSKTDIGVAKKESERDKAVGDAKDKGVSVEKIDEMNAAYARQIELIREKGRLEEAAEAKKKGMEKDAEAKKAAEDMDKATARTISAIQEEIRLTELKNQGLLKEAEVLKAITEARRANINLTDEEAAAVGGLAGHLFDLKAAAKDKDKDKGGRIENTGMSQVERLGGGLGLLGDPGKRSAMDEALGRKIGEGKPSMDIGVGKNMPGKGMDTMNTNTGNMVSKQSETNALLGKVVSGLAKIKPGTSGGSGSTVMQ